MYIETSEKPESQKTEILKIPNFSSGPEYFPSSFNQDKFQKSESSKFRKPNTFLGENGLDTLKITSENRTSTVRVKLCCVYSRRVKSRVHSVADLIDYTVDKTTRAG